MGRTGDDGDPGVQPHLPLFHHHGEREPRVEQQSVAELLCYHYLWNWVRRFETHYCEWEQHTHFGQLDSRPHDLLSVLNIPDGFWHLVFQRQPDEL